MIAASLRISLADLPAASALLKVAQLPDPPPDSGEAPQQQEEVRPQPREIKSPILHAVKAVAAPAAAFGLGTAGGYMGQMGVEKLLNLQGSAVKPLRRVSSVLGGLAGLAYQQYKSREIQELRRALESYKNQSVRELPTE